MSKEDNKLFLSSVIGTKPLKKTNKVTNHKSKLSSKRTCKQGHAKTYRIQKKEESYIHALQGNIRPPSDGENIGNAPRKPI